MAKATMIPNPAYAITLELSQAEAEAVMAVLGKNTANPSPTSGVWDALRDAGVDGRVYRVRSSAYLVPRDEVRFAVEKA